MHGKQALVIVDTQIRYVDDEYPLHNRDQFIANLQSLLGRARAAGTPVVYVQHFRKGEEPGQAGLAGIEIHPAIEPQVDEPVIPKRASDSFYQSELDVVLRQLGAETLVITGLQTEQCIDATCRSALSHGYDVVLVSDGHSTWDSAGLTARQIIDHHNATLPELAHPDCTAVVILSAEIAFDS
jgi:nicotinamidase-related amidase